MLAIKEPVFKNDANLHVSIRDIVSPISNEDIERIKFVNFFPGNFENKLLKSHSEGGTHKFVLWLSDFL